MEKAIWEEFEKLAVNCVNDLFCMNKTKISPTQYVKDNGYDATILSEVFQDDEMLYRIIYLLLKANLSHLLTLFSKHLIHYLLLFLLLEILF